MLTKGNFSKYKNQAFICIFLLLAANQSFSQKSFRVQRTAVPPVIDGRVNNNEWQTASMIDEFYQREPAVGEPMTESTKVYICYDADFIYFGVKCFQDPGTISAKEMLRDADTGSDDRFHVLLDTYLDHRNAYLFRITPLGGIMDAYHSQNGTVYNNNWNGVWTGKAKITEIGWEAEMAIPFKSIGFDKNSDRWGLRLNRYISKKREFGSWPVANINASQFQISDAGLMEGLEGITQGIGLDIAPYFISGFNSKREEKPDYKINGGMDLFCQITPSLKASISVNTDFAETEADSRQINLTRFNKRIAEKRNFFLEGANYFSFGLEGRSIEPPSGKINPFFSRNIGLDKNGIPVTVKYGTKLTGQVNKFNIGMLYVSDERDFGNSHFSIARVNYNLGNQSSLGMISTFGNPNDSTRNLLGGMDLKLASSRFLGNKNISLIMFGLKSYAENLHGKDVSWGGAFSYPNDFINFQIGHVEIGENFIAGLGYVPRSNIRETFSSLTFGPRLNKWGIRQVTFGGSFDYVTNFSWQLQSKEVTLNPMGIRFESGERFSYNVTSKYDSFEDDFNIYSDYIIPPGVYQWWENKLSFSTEQGRKLSGRISYGFGDFYTGTQNSWEIAADWKIAVPVFLGGTYTTDIVKLPEGKFLANIYMINLNLLFSPDLTLYNYFQYDSQSDVIGWQSRFQWIIKPGNEILLVWNSGYTKYIEHYSIDDRALRLKLKFLIRF
jgi:hypothetical protein